MGRVPNFKRITKEDFSSDDRELIERLAYPLNSFFIQIRDLFNKNIDFTNLNQSIDTIEVRLDGNGKPRTKAQYKVDVVGKVRGIICIKADNLTNVNTHPTSTPFIADYTQEGDIVIINNITGIQADNEYELTLLSIGD